MDLDMKITFVGSSHGVPEANRKCTCIMLQVGEKTYFVDMGAPAIDALRTYGVPVESVQGIFITHMHGDHTNGLISFVDLITWYFKKADPVICMPIIDAAKTIESWLEVTLNGNKRDIRYVQTEPGVIFDDGTLKVTAYATQHCHRSFGYLVEAEGKKVLFTGDLKNPGVDLPAPAKETALDLMVCESAHFPATDYLPAIEKSSIKKICVTHYSDTFLASVLQLQKELTERGVENLRATDGLVINV